MCKLAFFAPFTTTISLKNITITAISTIPFCSATGKAAYALSTYVIVTGVQEATGPSSVTLTSLKGKTDSHYVPKLAYV